MTFFVIGSPMIIFMELNMSSGFSV